MPVTAASIAAALIDRGMDPRELAGKQSLFTGVIERHAMLRSQPPEFLWWVPGRLEVFGKHTDYAGGRTLVCALPRGFGVAASARPDSIVRVADAWRGEEVTIQLSGERAPQTGWRRYVDVVARRLARNFPGARLGADVVIASDLPPEGGMSSSSALVISIAAALGRVAAIHRHPAWKSNIRHGLDTAGYYAALENGSRFAALDGDTGVGTHGGSEDHAAILEGRSGQVSAFAFVPARALGVAPVPDRWRFVIAESGVAAGKTADAREPYNRLAAGAALLLDAWNREAPRAVSLAAALRSGPDAAERLRALADRAGTPQAPAQWLRNRLDHFIREDARALEGLAAFADVDSARLGDLAAASQHDAETLLGNQVAATTALAAAARAEGAFAACSFGAGFGGAVWAVVRERDADAFAPRWHPGAFIVRPGPPVTELSGVA